MDESFIIILVIAVIISQGYIHSYVPHFLSLQYARWHTVVSGAVHANGTMAHFILGRKAYIHQLNAAGRLVAAMEGLFLVDFEAMVAGFHDSSYLLDTHHQSKWVSLELANVFLNLLEQLPSRPEPLTRDKFNEK